MAYNTSLKRPDTAHTSQTAASAQQQFYQTPDWEAPRGPIAKPKRSALDGLWPAKRSQDKETDLSRINTSASSIELGTASRPRPRPAFLATCSTRLDKLLPPQRKYVGLSRKRFLLFIVLPLLVLLLLVLPIALGVALGGKNKAKPLPIDTGGIWSGDLTYYAPGLGACGWTSGADDRIVAVSHLLFDAFQKDVTNTNQNPLCGKRIRVKRDFGGEKSVDVVVSDRCTGCDWTDLDVSPGVFGQLAKEEQGRVVAEWAWLDNVGQP